jgi:hypothetical protein
MQNECILREYAIQNTVDNIVPSVMHNEIRGMLNEIRVFDVFTATHKSILPNANLLPAAAVNHFKPWLKTYYIYLYSLNPTFREKSYKKLIRSINLFVIENPDFGVKKNGVIQTIVVSPLKMELQHI